MSLEACVTQKPAYLPVALKTFRYAAATLQEWAH